MVRIRLRRTGAKNNPAYRIVIADQRAPRDGAFIDTIGHYLPTRQPHVVEIDGAKAREWLGKGAQPSETVSSLLRQKGILDSQNKVTPEGTAAPEPRAAVPVAPTAVAPTAVAPTAVAPTAVAPTAVAPTVAESPAPAPEADDTPVVISDPAPDPEHEMPDPDRGQAEMPTDVTPIAPDMESGEAA